MKMFKALLVLIAACTLTLTAAAQLSSTPQSQTAKSGKGQYSPATVMASESSKPGRYQLFFSPHARADVYLLDTETGRIWHPVTVSNAQDTNLKAAPQIWIYEDRIDNEQQFDIWSASHKSLPTTTSAN
jgi:hypothetical protein